jgi:serine/threonine protein kinase
MLCSMKLIIEKKSWTESASIPFHLTDCPKGTLAYMDPEYFSTWMMTPQFDVYAFGIILLRMVTCKDPRGIRHLVEEAQRMVSLGLRCSNPVRKKRPDLSTEVWKDIKSMLDVASASASS